MLDTAISERDKAVAEKNLLQAQYHLLEDRHEQKITGLRLDNDILRDRLQAAHDANAVLRQETIIKTVIVQDKSPLIVEPAGVRNTE